MVRCADCGFLTYRDSGTKELREVGEDERKAGTMPGQLHGHVGVIPSPRCFVLALDIAKEIRDLVKSPAEPSRTLAVVEKERDCPAFCRWTPGFTPKEHKEMLLDIEARKQEADRQAREKSADRWWTLWSALAGAAIGFVGAIVAVFLTFWLTSK